MTFHRTQLDAETRANNKQSLSLLPPHRAPLRAARLRGPGAGLSVRSSSNHAESPVAILRQEQETGSLSFSDRGSHWLVYHHVSYLARPYLLTVLFNSDTFKIRPQSAEYGSLPLHVAKISTNSDARKKAKLPLHVWAFSRHLSDQARRQPAR